MAVFTALTGGFGLVLLIAVVMEATVRAAVRGDLPVNGLLGIRTSATKRSESAWRTGYAAAQHLLRVAAVVALTGAVVTLVLPFALGVTTDAADAVTTVAMLSAYAVVTALLLWATRVANAAARRAP